MADKYSAFGTQLLRGAVEIANVKDISGPELTQDIEDVTSHDSTGAWREKIGTLLDGGEITLELVFDPNTATHKYASGGLLYDFVSRAKNAYSLVLPSTPAVTWTFNALVTKFSPKHPVDGALTASATLTITGPVTLA